MKYENLKEFIISTKKSRSTINRFYKKNENLSLETKMKFGKKYYPQEHARYFDSEQMHDDNKVLRLENQSMRNLIDCLVDKESLQYRLWQMEWSFFATVSYKAERNKKSCFRVMNAMYEHIIGKYGAETGFNLFFTTEPFANRSGYHNHFVFHIANKKLHEQIVEEIKEYFNYDKVDLSIYDKYKAGLFYASKEGLVNEDWDILGNNLGKAVANEN